MRRAREDSLRATNAASVDTLASLDAERAGPMLVENDATQRAAAQLDAGERMPNRPPYACARCGQLVRGASCTSCGPRALWRGSARARGYSPTWDRVAADFRRRFPFCGLRADGVFHVEHSRCARAGRRVLAQCVDHIRPLREGGALLDETNLQSLCYSCNRLKG